MTYTTDTSIYTYTLSFKCSERRKCLAQIGLKKAFPWLIYETLPDGTIVVAGDILKDFQYGKHLRRQFLRDCARCKKRKQKSR